MVICKYLDTWSIEGEVGCAVWGLGAMAMAPVVASRPDTTPYAFNLGATAWAVFRKGPSSQLDCVCLQETVPVPSSAWTKEGLEHTVNQFR